MALQFNTFAKVNTLLSIMPLYGSGTGVNLKIYPSSVAMPALPPTSGSAPAGFLIQFTNFTTGRVNNQVKLGTAPAATAAVATGIPSWFFYLAGSTVMMGDSIGLAGTSPIITLNSMSLVSGTQYFLQDITLTMI